MFNINKNTGVLTQSHIDSQRKDSRYKDLGSTLTGTGYAAADRVLRKIKLVKDMDLKDYNLVEWTFIQNYKNILVEGDQSTGLSNFHGDYPYCSNRDSISSALLSEIGVGPVGMFRIVLVVKLFPTRNHNGSLPNEISLEEADKLGIIEHGGGSFGKGNLRRRVAKLYIQDIKKAVALNSATEIALTGMDYFEPKIKNCKDRKYLTAKCLKLIHRIEKSTGVKVSLVSTGPLTESTIELAG